MRNALLVAAALLGPGWLGAQQVPAQLTLEDALTIARERNPEYQRAVNTARAQGAQIRAGWGAFLPTINADMNFFGSSSQSVTGQDDFGRPVELPSPIDFRSSTASQNLRAQLTVFDGLTNLGTLRAARATASASDAARVAAATRIEAETTRRFYDALRTSQLISLEERLLTSAQEQFGNTQRLFGAGGATQEDVLGAEADVATQELNLETARNEAEKAKLAVREYLGIPADVEFSVTGVLPATWNPGGLDPEALVATATASHPQVQQLNATARAADLRASAARGSRWPSLSISATFSRSVSLSSFDALGELNPRNRAFQFGMTLSYPLFTGFRTSAQVASASLDARNSHEQRREGLLQIERNVRSAFIDVQNAYRGVELAQRAADLSSERLRLSRERYAIGAITFANLQLLIDRSAQEERRLVNARFQLAQAVVALDAQVGQPVRR